jgi:hypothetical protein
VSLFKQAFGVVLGAIILVLVILLWGIATREMTLYIERAWCWTTAGRSECEIRGAWTFLLWCVTGIANILIIGWALDRIGARLNHQL